MTGFLRRIFLNIIYSFTKTVGEIHAPFTRKKITAFDYHKIVDLARVGDVLLSRTEGELTNLFIPGTWTHAAIYAPDENPEIIEAVGKEGVSRKDLIEFMLKKDRVILLRPRFTDQNGAITAVKCATNMLGSPYDFQMQSDNKAFYCSEMVWLSYREALGETMPFTMRERLGQMTVTPDDFAKASRCWDLVYEI